MTKSQGQDPFGVVRQFAVAEPGVDREFTDPDGNKHTFNIARMAGIRDYVDIQTKLEGRQHALEAMKGKLAVPVPAAAVEGIPAELLPDLETLDEGKVQFFLTTKEELTMATALECCVRAPAFPWGAAALFVRLNGHVASQVWQAFQEINSALALDDAKND